MGENSTNSSRKKHIWVLVFLLLIAIVITAWAYVSQLKKSTPTENANVIGLVPEDTTSVSEEVQEETATVSPQTGESDGSNEDKKSTVKKGVTVYTAAQSQQRLVGYMDAEMTTVDGKGAWKSNIRRYF